MRDAKNNMHGELTILIYIQYRFIFFKLHSSCVLVMLIAVIDFYGAFFSVMAKGY